MRKSQLHAHIKFSFLLFAILLLGSPLAFAQKQLLQKADKLYKNKSFAQAIPVYEELLEEKRNLTAQTKLANCYRMTNQINEAERILEKVVQHERANSNAFFYYGEVLMSNEKYDEAKKWFAKYLKFEPKDEEALLRLESCDVVRNIEPFFENIKIEDYPYNSDEDDSSPVFYDNELVFCSDRSHGAKLLKQKAATTNREYLKIYTSSSMVSTTYDEPKPFSAKINELNKNTSNPSFWNNKRTGQTEIYFVRNNTESSKMDEYNLQLYRALSDNGKTWKKVERLNFCTKEKNYLHPSISPSGDTLFFVMVQGKGGKGGTDIYFSTRRRDNSWSSPLNIGGHINTSANEGFPYIHTNGQLYFCSKGHAGFGGYDIFVSQRNKHSGEWSTPINLGKPINSSSDDISLSFRLDSTGGAFTSSREGGDDDIFFFYLDEPFYRKGSFNGESLNSQKMGVERRGEK